MIQAGLFDRELTIQEHFLRFHEKNPGVYEALLRLAHQALRVGRTKASIKMMYEVVRWERFIAGLPDPEENWKLNNNYHSRYARLLMSENPELDGLFELRELRS